MPAGRQSQARISADLVIEERRSCNVRLRAGPLPVVPARGRNEFIERPLIAVTPASERGRERNAITVSLMSVVLTTLGPAWHIEHEQIAVPVYRTGR